jgi:hypothetical protein
MKLSRRGKSARRGRHTKRARKNLRYKGKKVRGSKRYHRGHKRTHKRGRRLQRGGVNFHIEYSVLGDNIECSANAIITGVLNPGLAKFDLKYQKKYWPSEQTSQFSMTGKLNREKTSLTFIRYNKSGIKDNTFVIDDINMLTDKPLLEAWKSIDGSTYNFNYPENTATLQQIFTSIANEKSGVELAEQPPTESV